MAMNENPLDAFHRFKDRIFCTHLKDACPKERYPDASGFGLAQIQFCALGEGILPIKEILAELIAAKGKEAHITLEIPTPLQTSLTQDNLLQQEVDNVFKSIEFIRRESLEL
ncbi:MAG: sugar phosphate isomerase/epimerase [Lentisphaerae bacterium]|nr:sugar phosphate isomerase/epimerase [Lentisphaerota bacterium]